MLLSKFLLLMMMQWPMEGKSRLYLKLWELPLASTSVWPVADLSRGKKTKKQTKLVINNSNVYVFMCHTQVLHEL